MTVEPVSLDQLRAGFADPQRDTAPMMRWWWFGPAVDRAELDRELTAMAAAGIGGVEVAYVYPLAPATAAFLDDDFGSLLRYAAERARELGLRFDLTLGSGWSFGGPHIPDELAARCLHWERREIPPGPREVDVTPRWPGEEFLVGLLGAGSIQEQPDDYVPLSVDDGILRIPDGAGPRQMLLAGSRLTSQNVKRAAAGAEGPVLDHYSADAVRAHLHAVGDRLLAAVPADLLGSVFCDSLEVYDADWTPALPEEFERRRGYPLLPVLHLLAVDGPDAPGVRADYHRTLVELYEENFVTVVRQWAAEHGVPFRIQGYGTPPAMISSYRFADLIEGEGWGWKRIAQTRWASSAGHLYGHEVISSETWTWVHSPSFRATPLDLKGEAHEHLLNGINALVGHGWPYSPADAPGLGWFFYAAGALDDRNPWWPAMPELTRYLARLCWLMRQGEPVADVAVYVPSEDVFAQLGAAQSGSLDAWREARGLIGDRVAAEIREAGFDYDLVDDESIAVLGDGRYRVLVVPPGATVSDEAAGWFDRVTATGGTVISTDDQLGSTLRSALSPDLGIKPPSPDIGFVHRRTSETDIYLVVNTGPERQPVGLTPRIARDHWQRWDPDTGAVIGYGPTVAAVAVCLEAYQATVLVFSDDDHPAMDRDEPPRRRLPLASGWTVRFGDEDPQPVSLPHRWEDEPARRHHSGSAVYATTFTLPDSDTADADTAAVGPIMIDLGDFTPGADRGSAQDGMVGPSYRVASGAPVGEVARVELNGVDCGVVWAPPYRLELTGGRAGVNELTVEVFNTAANALAVEDHIGRLAAESEARYGRRFRMQQLDRAMDGVSSGLLVVPEILIG